MKKRKTNPIFLISFLVLLIAIPAILIIYSLNKSPVAKSPFSADTTITKDTGNYAYKNSTNNFTTHFKVSPTDPDSIVFANSLGKISFYTPKTQVFGDLNSDNPPISTGSVLTYPNIYTQTDLRYTISTSRLLEEFIIKDKNTANKITQIKQIAKTDSTYKENADGSITFSQNGKTAFILPAPVLYEENDTSKRSNGIKYEIKNNQNQLAITKVITPEGMTWINDKSRVFPIVVDLVIDNADTAGNWISSDTTHTVVSQENTIKHEGTGSVKVQTNSGVSIPIDPMEYSSDANAEAAYVSNSTPMTATGGVVTTIGGYTINTFTSGGTFTPSFSGNVQALVVAGGGGGGSRHGGGGGAGGYQYNPATVTATTPYTIAVGSGGAGPVDGSTGNDNSATDGSNSSALGITANGGGAGKATVVGDNGGSGGGGGEGPNAGGTGSQGNNGGAGWNNGGDYAGGGGGGAGSIGGTSSGSGGTAGSGVSNSITGSPVTYAAGGSGGLWSASTLGAAGAANTGNGGGGSGGATNAGGHGGSGIVVISYLNRALQSFSESSIKTQGSYSLKGFALATNSLNNTLTRNISPTLDLSNQTSITFDMQSSRTGSNIKIGLHDTGGTTTEITPNITSAGAYQSVAWDISGVTNANKDTIDSIIITVMNATADNTFYIDNMTSTGISVTNSGNLDTMEYSSDANAEAAYVASAYTATGGNTITTSGVYTINTFTSNGTFTPSANGNVDVLVVGGGGGARGGGGGGGGVIYNTGFTVSTSPIAVTVGAAVAYDTQGNSSIFSSITANGGGKGAAYGANGNAGGNGGGGATSSGGAQTGGAGNQGYAGGNSSSAGNGGGGGGGGGAAGSNQTVTGTGGAGGVGAQNSISGISTYYGGGGGGGGSTAGGAGTPTTGGGGAGNSSGTGTAGTNGLGGGGGGSYATTGGGGGSGVVIVRYLTNPLQSYSEPTIKTQGSYSLKGIAYATNSLNQTLTKTLSSTVNLAGVNTVKFDIRSTRTGSNIKLGLHDATSGTTTEITPNITSAGAFQTVTWNISGVSDTNKGTIDKIIVTIVNAAADNTFYLDNMTYSDFSVNDTVVRTISSTDFSSIKYLTFWTYSSTKTGTFATFTIGQNTGSLLTPYSINIANTGDWEEQTWDISALAGKTGITVLVFKFTSDPGGTAFYFDDVRSNAPPNIPALSSPSNGATDQILTPSFVTNTTDPDADYVRYQINLCKDSGMSSSCQTFTEPTTYPETGWTGQDAQSDGTHFTAYASGTVATYTVQSALDPGVTYYWKSLAIDPGGSTIYGSTQVTPYSFTTSAAPTAPTGLLTQGLTNPTGLTTTPYFSAMHNDPDGDPAVYYQILVNTASDFTGTSMWDSGTTSVAVTANNSRSPDITYAGSTLSSHSITYYWKIRFTDSKGAVGVYSSVASFETRTAPVDASDCRIQETQKDTSLTIVWTDNATDEDNYEVQRSVGGGVWAVLATGLVANTVSYTDSTISDGNTYQYRVAPYYTSGPSYANWCTTATLSLQLGTFSLKGVNLKGLILH